MKIGVVVFPGSNCDHDAWYAFSEVLQIPVELIWHTATSLGNVDAVILPGGFCNGVQVLTESGLLPGALVRNKNLKFICREVPLRIETSDSPFTRQGRRGQILQIPVAHGEGCYIADERTLDQLEAEDRVVLRYVENCNG